MAGEIIFQGTGEVFFFIHPPLHFTGFSTPGRIEESADESEDVNTSKPNEPTARNNNSMAERLIMA